MSVIERRYGRLLSEFEIGASYLHPWEVTVDDGMAALFAASFQDASPVYASRPRARAAGFRDRPLGPMLCLNLALSFSVHDVSEQAIAHLAYLDVRFPEAGYIGDTVRARSTVLGVAPASSGDRGVVHVRTRLESEAGRVLCTFERKALIPAGPIAAARQPSLASPPSADRPRLPLELESAHAAPPNLATDGSRAGEGELAPGQVYAHSVGKTIGESEHMQLTQLCRNSHPLHFDELYAREHSFAKTRVVYGGLVFAWTVALASRDVAGGALWDLGYDDGAHPAGVIAGDTIYAASRVLGLTQQTHGLEVQFRLVGVKNLSARAALERHGEELFTPERSKREGKIPEKVFEITRSLLVARRRS